MDWNRRSLTATQAAILQELQQINVTLQQMYVHARFQMLRSIFFKTFPSCCGGHTILRPMAKAVPFVIQDVYFSLWPGSLKLSLYSLQIL